MDFRTVKLKIRDTFHVSHVRLCLPNTIQKIKKSERVAYSDLIYLHDIFRRFSLTGSRLSGDQN